LAIINKYGFKFDGVTSIASYKNELLPLDDFEINFNLKMSTNPISLNEYIFSSGDLYDGIYHIYVNTDGDLVFSIAFGFSNITTIKTLNNVNSGNVENIKIKSYHDGSSYKIEIYRNEILQNIKAYYTAETQINIVSIPTYGFGRTQLGYFYEGVVFDYTISTNGLKVFEETFDNVTKGTISVPGTEQYEIISSYERIGVLLEKKDSWLETTNSFSKVIEEYFYGGEITFSWDNPGVTSVQLLGYDEKLKSARILATSNNPAGNSVTFNVGEVAVRRMKVIIESSSTIGNVSYLIAHLFDIWTNTENTPTNARIIDNDVFYNSITLNNKAVSFRVPDEKTNIAKNLLQNKVYLDDVEYQMAGLNAVEFDINNWAYNANFIEVLNG
jgi:hypothetical protein